MSPVALFRCTAECVLSCPLISCTRSVLRPKDEVEDEGKCDNAEDDQIDEALSALLLVVLRLSQFFLCRIDVGRGARHVLVKSHELLPLILNFDVDVLGNRVDVLHD